MKRKLLTALISTSMILSMASITSFAQTNQVYINDVKQLKAALQQNVATEVIKDNVAPEVAEEFMEEKLDQAAEMINGQEFVADMQKQADGSLYDRQSFDLGDGCQLIVELSDKSEAESAQLAAISRAATANSSTQWYGYGNRSFTAKASVTCAVGTANMNLTNRYTLSANGIDERTGDATGSCSSGKSSISHTPPQITDSAARTPGASDVNMHCDYSLTTKSVNGVPIKNKYRLNTAIGYLDINKSTKKIRVKESWSMVKVS